MSVVLANKNSHSLANHAFAIFTKARDAGIQISPSRTIDVFKSLSSIDFSDRTQFQIALRVNLVSSKEHEALFDRVFDNYWNNIPESDGDYILANSEMIRGDLDVGLSNEGHRDMLSESDSFADSEVSRKSNLGFRWDDQSAALQRLIRTITRKLATRPSRRRKISGRGDRIDVRHSVRNSIPFGMELLKLSTSKQKVRKTRIIMLCDVSGSMDVFNPFLLQLMLGVQKLLKNSRTIVFSTKISEITGLLKGQSVLDVLNKVAKAVRHWSGGTNIAEAIAQLNRGLLLEGSAKSTVLVIVSDGYDNGDIERIVKELTITKRYIRSLVWINPMYGASSFEVRSKTMKAAMPFIDEFLPAYNTESLEKLVAGLHRIK